MSRYNGEIPKGASVEANIREMQEYRKTHGYDQTLYYFFLKVKSGGEWDYKRYDKVAMANGTKSKYEDFGNYNYGVVGKAIGLPTSILLSGAGGAQITSSSGGLFPLNAMKDFIQSLIKGNNSREFGINDDPNDRKNILNGIDDYSDLYSKKYNGIDGATDYWKNFIGVSNTNSVGYIPAHGGVYDTYNYYDPYTYGYNGGYDATIYDPAFTDYLNSRQQWDDYFKNNSNDDCCDGKCVSCKVCTADTKDPFVLDLNGDNKIDIISLAKNKIYFDHANDGQAERTSWIGKNDGLLVLDKNGNNKIDNGNELFGNFTIKQNGEFAKDGFDALSDLDSNNDGIISNLDDKFSELKIWQDLNEDGITDNGELKSLSEHGIKSINLAKQEVSENLVGGNKISAKGSFTKTDGNVGLSADIDFSVDESEFIDLNLDSTNEKEFSKIIKNLALKYGNDIFHFNSHTETANPNLLNSNENLANLDITSQNLQKQNNGYINSFQIDKLIEQVNTYSSDSAFDSFAFNDIKSESSLQIYG